MHVQLSIMYYDMRKYTSRLSEFKFMEPNYCFHKHTPNWFMTCSNLWKSNCFQLIQLRVGKNMLLYSSFPVSLWTIYNAMRSPLFLQSSQWYLTRFIYEMSNVRILSKIKQECLIIKKKNTSAWIYCFLIYKYKYDSVKGYIKSKLTI